MMQAILVLLCDACLLINMDTFTNTTQGLDFLYNILQLFCGTTAVQG